MESHAEAEYISPLLLSCQNSIANLYSCVPVAIRVTASLNSFYQKNAQPNILHFCVAYLLHTWCAKAVSFAWGKLLTGDTGKQNLATKKVFLFQKIVPPPP